MPFCTIGPLGIGLWEVGSEATCMFACGIAQSAPICSPGWPRSWWTRQTQRAIACQTTENGVGNLT